jgi:hypothetical protein
MILSIVHVMHLGPPSWAFRASIPDLRPGSTLKIRAGRLLDGRGSVDRLPNVHELDE